MMLMRTVKSCRSGAPMLASSLREEAQATVSNKRGHRGEREVSRKTIARGMPGDFRRDRGDYARMLILFCMRGCGRFGRPAFPAPSVIRGTNVRPSLGRIAPRECGRISSRLFEIESEIATCPDVLRHNENLCLRKDVQEVGEGRKEASQPIARRTNVSGGRATTTIKRGTTN